MNKAGSLVLISIACSGFSIAGGALYGHFSEQRRYERLMQLNFVDHYLKPPPVKPGEIGPQGMQEDYDRAKVREKIYMAAYR